MSARGVRVVLTVAVLLAAAVAIAAAFGAFSASARHATASKFVSSGRYGQGAGQASDSPGEGPVGTYDAYLSALRTYPANVIPPAVVARGKQTFTKIDQEGEQGGDSSGGNQWHPYGPLRSAVEPGVLAFSGATDATASRVTAMVIAPTCHPGNCRVWVGVAGGGVWRTRDATAANPAWTWLTNGIAQNSVGALSADPNDPSGNTLYLGTGEANRCISGCEAGVGVYKTTDGGDSWTKLADSCVSNSTYSCTIAGLDAFLGRGITKVVIDPTNPNHLFVGSALGVRGLSHTIGNGAQTRFEPGANPVGVYESNDGGQTFTEVWNGNGATFGITDLGLDPADPHTVYASAFDNGLWRRSPALDGAASPTDFKQVFAAQFVPNPPAGIDRTMFAATTLANGKTRLYLTDGTANGGGPASPTAANFWRTDNANQPAATLLASQGAGKTPPPAPGIPFPSSFNGWQVLTSGSTTSPYFATVDFCTGQCWYDEVVYTPKGMPDTVYVIGSYQYGEIACNTKGVGCGNGRSNGRAVLYSTTAGDPDPAHSNRTFTDLTNDSQDTAASWCALQGISPCLRAPDSIHPDQHAIVVNPSNPTQIFEGSDGGVIRTSGTFQDISAQCNDPGRPPAGTGSYLTCQRLLSSVPAQLAHTDLQLDTLQFVNVAINPGQPCEVMGGTQDNGTWSNPGCGLDTWPQIIYGDGGNAGYDGTNPTWRFNEFSSGFSDSNFQNGDPTKWVITSAPIVNSGENVSFYWPQIADPNPPTGAHPIFSGAQHVWRTWAFGAGKPGKIPQDTTPNISGYEATCPEFTTGGNDPKCGDYQALGGPMGANTPGDLTGTVYGADRTGGAISWLARVEADHGTLWAATSAGRVFVSHNADAVDPKAVVWHRIDNATSPSRYPSSIYPDPSDTTHAWVTYSGYNAATPTTPGHVFDVHEGGPTPGSGVFTNLKVENGTAAFPTPTGDGDLPVSDIVRDDARHKLYVSTDFGVLRANKDGKGGWRVMSGMPRLEVMHLEIEPSARVPTCTGASKDRCPKVIYAATHSQGIWALNLNRGGDNGGGDNGGGGNGGGGDGGGGGGGNG
jgi:hypothetical protein